MNAKTYYKHIQELWQGATGDLELYATINAEAELGELFGAYAKYIRGDYDIEILFDRLRKELGDWLWMYVAVNKEYPVWSDRLDMLSMSEVFNILRTPNSQYLAAILGYKSWEEVADDNIAKLMDRKQRGVLKGDGDER